NMDNEVLRILSVVRRNFATAVLGIKAQIGLKQTVSLLAMFQNVPIADIGPGIREFLSNPKRAVEIMNRNIFIKTRGENFSVEAGDVFSDRRLRAYREKPTLRNYLMLPVRIGDVMPIYMGGWVLYRSLLKPKNAGAEFSALDAPFDEKMLLKTAAHAEQTQQSRLLSNTTPAQDHPFGRLFVMFTSSPTALAKMEVIAIIKVLQKREGSKKELARAIMIYHFMIPMMFQFVADIFRPTREQYRAMILGPFNGVAILGDIMQFAVAEAIGTKNYRYNVFALDLMNELMGIMGQFNEDDLDYSEFITDILELSGTLAGLPVETGFNITEGLLNIPDTNKPISDSVARIFGWPPSLVDERFKE
ncbi:MAG: hypothetical protein IIB38_14625, partial [Candidatus Hydrogenedentes bacterium]|nr:hypothetical protein [Candidatus Hydrogenedentota bacterium]